MVTKYNNAYTEVYVIINSLAREDYNKIPLDMIHAIRENRNKNYRFAIDEHLNLKEQKLLPETKAILFNLFRDYLATKEQRNKILNFQYMERIHLEKKKKEEYKGSDNLFTSNNKKKSIEKNEKLPIVIKRENFVEKVINFIKSLFMNKEKEKQ